MHQRHRCGHGTSKSGQSDWTLSRTLCRRAEGGRRGDAGGGRPGPPAAAARTRLRVVVAAGPCSLRRRRGTCGVRQRRRRTLLRQVESKAARAEHTFNFIPDEVAALLAEAAPFRCLWPIVGSEVLTPCYWSRRYNRGPDISL